MMRTVNAGLQNTLNSRAFAVSQCLVIKPVNGPKLGLTNADEDQYLVTDPMSLAFVCKSIAGFEDSAYQQSAGVAVNNAEAKIIFPPESAFGITLEQARAGYLDGARFWLYMVDRSDNFAGSTLIDWGFVGQIRLKDSIQSIIELRGVQQMMRQKAICERGSKTCRAVALGDQATGCHFDMTGQGGSGTVMDVGVETDVIFNAGIALPQHASVRFTSGANVGWEFEVESCVGTTAQLLFQTPYPIAVGDSYVWLPGCNKTFAMCKTYGQVKNFRGEPNRPEAIGDSLQFPGSMF